MITLDAVRDQSINTVIEQIGKENVMKTLLLSLMQKHTSDGLTFVQAKLDKPRLWNHRRYRSVTPSSGISQALYLWEPPCWGRYRWLRRIIPLPRLVFTAIVLGQTVLRTCRA